MMKKSLCLDTAITKEATATNVQEPLPLDKSAHDAKADNIINGIGVLKGHFSGKAEINAYITKERSTCD